MLDETISQTILKDMVARSAETGQVTKDEIRNALGPKYATDEAVDENMQTLSELEIDVTESEDTHVAGVFPDGPSPDEIDADDLDEDQDDLLDDDESITVDDLIERFPDEHTKDDDEKSKKKAKHESDSDVDDDDDSLDEDEDEEDFLWGILYDAGHKLPFVNTVYGNATFQMVDKPKRFDVFVTTSGFMLRESAI